MNEKLPSAQPLTEQEVAIEFDLMQGEYADGISAIEDFHGCRQALFAAVESVMRGESEFTEESEADMAALLMATAQTYAFIFEDEKNFEDKVYYTALSLQSAVDHLKAFIDTFDVPVDIVENGVEVYEEALRRALIGRLPEHDYSIFEDLYGGIHLKYLNELLEHAPDTSV